MSRRASFEHRHVDACDELVHVVERGWHRRVRAHPSGVGAAVAVEDALEVLGRPSGMHASRRRSRTATPPPSSSSSTTIALPASRTRRRAPARRSASVSADEHALARREAVGLDHARRAADRCGRPSIVGRVVARGGTPAAAMTSLAKAFDPSSRPPPRPGRRPGCRRAAARRRRRRPAAPRARSRRGRPRLHRERQQRVAVGDAHGVARRERAMPGLPGAPCSSLSEGSRERAGERVLAPAGADQQDLHAASLLGAFRSDHQPGGGRFPDGVALPISVATLFPTRGQPLGARAAAFRCAPVPASTRSPRM